MILRTRRAFSSAASPISPLPALLFTIVKPRAPWPMSASMSAEGMPAVPKPPIMIVAPSGMSATAASSEGTVLSIIEASFARCRRSPSPGWAAIIEEERDRTRAARATFRARCAHPAAASPTTRVDCTPARSVSCGVSRTAPASRLVLDAGAPERGVSASVRSRPARDRSWSRPSGPSSPLTFPNA